MKMTTTHHAPRLCCIFAVVLPMVGAVVTSGQGTITFNDAAYFSGTNYVEAGVGFALVVPTPGGHDGMAISPPVTQPWNTPYNTTPYMVFFQQYSPDDYIALSLVSGSAFGLTSVQLADPSSPSSSLLPITFVGHKADGSTVTDTFTTPGGGADHLASYQFTSDFASGLTSVDVLAARWAMDNVVFTVPEPGVGSLMALGVVALLARKLRGGSGT
jgi:hypothetical protein